MYNVQVGLCHSCPSFLVCFPQELAQYLRFFFTEIYKPRRSIIFVTEDATYLDISSAEFIEENRREYGERAVAYVSINNALSKGK